MLDTLRDELECTGEYNECKILLDIDNVVGSCRAVSYFPLTLCSHLYAVDWNGRVKLEIEVHCEMESFF